MLSTKPDTFPNFLRTVSAVHISFLLFKNRMPSSAYWITLTGFLGQLKTNPSNVLQLLIFFPKISAQTMNNKADTEHPCLIPLDIPKVSEKWPLFFTHATG